MKGKVLKFSDALHLSWSNISQHKGRSAIVILTISILFGVVMAFNFMLEGLSKTTFDAAMQASDGKIYIAAGYNEIASINEGDYFKVNNLEDAEKAIVESVKRYHGQIIGQVVQYNGIGSSRWTINQELAERFDELDFDKLQEDQIPYVGPKVEDEFFDLYLKDADDNKDKLLVKVGTYPATEPGSPTLPGFNPLNLLLSGIHGFYTAPLMVDDGSGKVMRYLEKMAEQNNTQEVIPYIEQFVVMFDNYDDAIAYYWDIANGKNIPKEIETSDGKKYVSYSEELFSNVISAELSIKNLRYTLILIEILFIVVAVIIATLTFAHIIDQDAATIALYRSLGVSTGNIYLIYFLYLLEMCILAVVACIVIAAILVGALWLVNANALAQRLQNYYMLDTTPKVTLFRFDNLFYGIIGSVMLIAPITLLFTLRNFSSKHIAKKLKED